MSEVHERAPSKVHEIVTEKIIAALDAGVVPWKQPWVNLGRGGHKNLESKRSYRGINQLLLQVSEYEQPWWITFNGAKRLGGSVAKGERSTIVVWTKTVRCATATRTIPTPKKEIWMLRYYRVWNVEQTEGLEQRIPEPPDLDSEFSIDPVERVRGDRRELSGAGPEDQAHRRRGVLRAGPRRGLHAGAGAVPDGGELLRRVRARAHPLHRTPEAARPRAGPADGWRSESYSREELVAEIGCGDALRRGRDRAAL